MYTNWFTKFFEESLTKIPETVWTISLIPQSHKFTNTEKVLKILKRQKK
jgi:hypothetical protein